MFKAAEDMENDPNYKDHCNKLGQEHGKLLNQIEGLTPKAKLETFLKKFQKEGTLKKIFEDND